MTTYLERSAHISPCGRYRYRLTRAWDYRKPTIAFVMLNPSTADGTEDDPTIRKCVGFAQRLGYGVLIVANLYAFRATDPAGMWSQRKINGTDIVGPENDTAIARATVGRTVVLAWGAHARGHHRAAVVATDAAKGARPLGLGVLARLADGTPAHPLMLPYSCVDGSRLHASLIA